MQITSTAVTQMTEIVGIQLQPCGNQYELSKNEARIQATIYRSIGGTKLVRPTPPIVPYL